MSRHLAAIPAAALEDPAVSDTMLRMLLVLGGFANKDGWCWPKLDTLAARMRISRAAVSKILTRIREAGYLDMHYEVRDSRRRCVFRVLFDRPASTATAIDDAEYESGLALGVPKGPRRVAVEETQVSAAMAGEGVSRVAVVETGDGSRVAATETERGREFPPRRPPVAVEETSFLRTLSTELKDNPRLADASVASSVVDEWNDMAGMAGLPKARVTPKRAKVIGTRVREAGWRADFTAACAAVAASPFHRGANDRGWRASLDYLLQAGKATALAEEASVPRAAAPAGAEASVLVGRQRFTASQFWVLCAGTGLAAPMQSREALDARVRALQESGRVEDPRRFTALVLHVEPWALADIRFAKERDERLRDRLASWRPTGQAEAS